MNRFDIALNRLPISELSASLDSRGEISHVETERILVLGDGVREMVKLGDVLDDPTERITAFSEEKIAEVEEESEPGDMLFDYMMDDAERILQSSSAIKYLIFIHDRMRHSTEHKIERAKKRGSNFFFDLWEDFQCKGLKTRAHALYLSNIMRYRDLNPLVSNGSKAKFLNPDIILNWASNLDKVYRIVASCDKGSFLNHYNPRPFDVQLRSTEDEDSDWDGPAANHRVIPDRVVFGKVSWLVRVLA